MRGLPTTSSAKSYEAWRLAVCRNGLMSRRSLKRWSDDWAIRLGLGREMDCVKIRKSQAIRWKSKSGACAESARTAGTQSQPLAVDDTDSAQVRRVHWCYE